MLPRAHLPNQELILSVMLNKNMTTSNVHPLYLPPVVCWINGTYEQVRRWKLKLYILLRLASTSIILATILAHVLHLCDWSLLSTTGAIWSLSVCATLVWGMCIGSMSATRRSEYDQSKSRLHPDFGVSLASSLLLCSQLMLMYVCTWAYRRTCQGEGAAQVADSSCYTYLYVWTVAIFLWINTVGFIRLFRHI